MNGMTALALGYLGMLVALGVWTWTVMSRGRDIERRLASTEAALGLKDGNVDPVLDDKR
ncbi:MAG TPA: hypothetical protein HA276_01140 [Candidatus Poseidoniaceae archaeon]|nr:hypothetical protein [Candidatus Poseidoniaceae archaeon]HII96270.1 hypothetical protein [Candidatus Poseidoniaceae archaeon]|tara:strand:- start:966 stop:1142 length:177 start_codon:yes stop_codon:yes gene_type:complete